ncbi:hypothetical protein EDD36DRAFT_466142 [Exophiala viscosa]|uniref:Uncharacterized protein n=1 Tax=Exophiala viscosa TaxID=2486360 RepID=A0AAN6ICD9_9EURO|nr:hypothetical protein EDD36DRAFT_466142 [Exophiala viscosa]
MPPKRTSRKSAPMQQTRSFLRGDNENEWDDGHGGGNDSAEHEAGTTVDLREVEENLKRSMAVDTGLRQEQKQLRLEREFERQISDLEGSIHQKEVGCREEMNRVHDAHVTKLLTLTLRKGEIEAQIVKHTQELADAYIAMRGEFEAVVKGRSEDVDGAIEALKKLDQEATQGEA